MGDNWTKSEKTMEDLFPNFQNLTSYKSEKELLWCFLCFIHERVLLSVLQVIRILKELKQKYPDKELDQLVELANYYALLHQQKSRAFYRIQVIRTCARAQIINSEPRGPNIQGCGRPTKEHNLVQGCFFIFILIDCCYFCFCKQKRKWGDLKAKIHLCSRLAHLVPI